MTAKIRRRLEGEGGFTLIELLVVIIILGILLAIAVPSYLGFRDRANVAAAKSNVRAALPAAETYYQDPVADGGGGGSYTGMTPTKLLAIDSGLSSSLSVPTATATSYCLQDTVGGKTAHVVRPGPGTIAKDACP